MERSALLSPVLRAARAAGTFLQQWFPVPQLLFPRSAGIDISDSSIKWVVFDGRPWGLAVSSWGEEPLEAGIVENGTIKDVPRLSQALARVKNRLGKVDCAHAALPEEAAYVYSMHVPAGSSRKQVMTLIEFELEARVPIPPASAVYDFHAIEESGDETGSEIGVVVFPRELAESYVAAFRGARLQLLSLELEPYSIARAVSEERACEPTTLLVDFGRARTGFAVLKCGVPIFTSTVGVGADSLTRSVMEKLSVTAEEARFFNNEEGLRAKGGVTAPGVEAITGVLASLTDEITRHFHYWDTRRNEKGERVTPVERVYLVGGGSNLRGLVDYVAGRVQASTTRPNLWGRVASFDDYIPPIDRRASLQYATAIGLALRGHKV